VTEASELQALADQAAREAGDILLGHFRGPAHGVDAKSTPTDPVSDADRAAESFLFDFISSRRPDDGVLAEEGTDEKSSSGLTWIVDPLDGTVNFLFGIPHWSVSIAVEDDEGGLVGVIFDPNRGEMFTAIRGAGAQVNGSSISVSLVEDLSQALIGTGFSYDAEARRVQAEVVGRVLPRARDIRRAGSAALDLASVSCGRLDGFYEAPMEPWDKAAGIVIATEAGARISELPPPTSGLSSGVIAANPALHEQLSALVT
jgi:myo-inositol-1(or 4)-monophosphatase